MADGYWEILHSKNAVVYVKGGKDAGKTKFIGQLKVILMLAFPWYNVFSLRQDLRQHSGSTKEHFVWAISLLSKILDFPVEIMFKITKLPIEITHRYHKNVLKTFSGNTNTENKVSSQEIGGIEGIIGMLDYDEPTSNKTPTDEKIKEEIEWWGITQNSNMERGTEFATQHMLDWQMTIVACNPWQPNSSFDQLYANPYVHIDRKELKDILTTKYKYVKQVKNFTANRSLLIMITNAMLIEDILEQTVVGREEIAKRQYYFSEKNINSYQETFFIGLSGYIEGGVYEFQRENINLVQQADVKYPHPIAVSFGVDYANKQDKMVLSVNGFSANYNAQIKYQDFVIAPQDYRDQRHRDIFIANSFVMHMFRWLGRLDMPKHLRYRCIVDGDFFRQTLDKAWLDYMNDPNLEERFRYTIKFVEKENIRVQERVKDDKELMSSGRLIVDEDLCSLWIQEINTVQWSTDTRTAFAGNDDCIQATHYARDPYRNKLMKGERDYEII